MTRARASSHDIVNASEGGGRASAGQNDSRLRFQTNSYTILDQPLLRDALHRAKLTYKTRVLYPTALEGERRCSTKIFHLYPLGGRRRARRRLRSRARPVGHVFGLLVRPGLVFERRRTKRRRARSEVYILSLCRRCYWRSSLWPAWSMWRWDAKPESST